MKLTIHKLLLISLFVVLFIGCASFNTRQVGPTSMMKARQEIPEDQLLDVGIQVFTSEKIMEKQIKNEHTSPEVRKAERHFIPYHLKNTLQQSSYWGAVRVLPTEKEITDVTVKGKIIASNGEHLVLEVSVVDATGKRWFRKKYESKATSAFYSGNQVGKKDAYQDIYNAISNDMAEYRKKLPIQKIKNIRTVSKLKFAEDFAPDAFSGYLSKDDDAVAVNRLPAENDPIMARLMKIREREYMYVDTLNAYYEEYYKEMWPSYENWRKLNYKEIKAIKKIKKESLTNKLAGALLVAGAIALSAGDVKNTGALQTGMILIGGQVIIHGFNISKEAEMNSAAIKELSESFGSEMRPVIMDFEDKKYKLTGSAEEQFNHWRELLRQIYIAETGFNPDVPPKNGKQVKPDNFQ